MARLPYQFSGQPRLGDALLGDALLVVEIEREADHAARRGATPEAGRQGRAPVDAGAVAHALGAGIASGEGGLARGGVGLGPARFVVERVAGARRAVAEVGAVDDVEVMLLGARVK